VRDNLKRAAEKEKIKTAFAGAAETYDSVAEVQALSSAHLCEMIKATMISAPPGEILDIGCGTGITSLEAMKIYPGAKYTLCDISDEMIRESEKKIKNAQFIVCDAEKYDFPGNRDLGISNLAVQWFESLDDFLGKILKHCRYFAFSTLTDGSFFDRKKKLENCGVFSEYPSSEELLNICRQHGFLRKYDTKRYNLQFETFRASCKYFKKLGATANFTGKNHENLFAILRNKHAADLNYDVFFGIIERR
jgi:malonyl-ACP O-methyltransferase BioC